MNIGLRLMWLMALYSQRQSNSKTIAILCEFIINKMQVERIKIHKNRIKTVDI